VRVFPDGDSPDDDKLFVMALFDPDEDEIIHLTVGDSKEEFDKGLLMLQNWMDEHIRLPMDPDLSKKSILETVQSRSLDGKHVVQYMQQRGWLTDEQFKGYLMMLEGNHPVSTETAFGEEKVPFR